MYGQNGTASATEVADVSEMAKEHRLGFHLAPLSIINRRPRVRAGIWVNLRSTSLVLDLEYGKGNNHPLFSGLKKADITMGIRPEFRYHLPQTLNQGKPNRFGYAGFEFPITVSELDLEGVTYPASDGKRYDVDATTQRRLRISGIFKAGYQLAIGKIFYADMYAGIGYGLRQITYLNPVNQVQTFDPPDEEWGLSSDEQAEGNSGILEIALGFRLGIAL
ncbi:hypothetical protein CEQ90_04540 [Lewinellaceae bacterium SD302]|nr:hypothetical protein CEQ90_04540 [Lewinellaceae bacterium SD302]